MNLLYLGGKSQERACVLRQGVYIVELSARFSNLQGSRAVRTNSARLQRVMI